MATQVAAAIAQCLGIELVRREHLERQIAERLRIDEGVVRRMLAGDASLLERWTSDRGRLRHAMTEQVVRLAVRGDVLIQTWGIAPVLRPVRHLICLHLRAPALARECLARRSPAMGEGAMAAETHSRKSVSLPISGKLSHGRSDVELYDLVITADRICVAQCVEQVRRLTLDPLFQPTVASQSMLASLMRETGRSAQPIFGLGGTRAAPALEVVVGRDTISCGQQYRARKQSLAWSSICAEGRTTPRFDADEPSFSAQQASLSFQLTCSQRAPSDDQPAAGVRD